MKIEQSQIEAIKQTHDLIAVMQSKGILLKKQGKQYMGKCPFHPDKKASMSVDPVKQLFHCFGCNTSGDTIGFLSKIERKSFPTLLRELLPQTNGNPLSSPLIANGLKTNIGFKIGYGDRMYAVKGIHRQGL